MPNVGGRELGERRTNPVTGKPEKWIGSGWVDAAQGEEPSKPSVGLSSGESKPKIQTKGESSVSETQTKSLSTILKERAEKAAKAKAIREGGGGQ